MKRIFKRLNRSRKLGQFLRRNILKPKWLYFLRSNPHPISEYCGFDRGTPLDRFFIEAFLEKEKINVKGRCLELLDDSYTKRFGSGQVIQNDVLDINPENPNATIIDDLRCLKHIKSDTYDCIILTQVLQFIDDVDSAIAECYRILAPNGVLLATLPALSRADGASGVEADYWRFTTASAKYLFFKVFEKENVVVTSYGNARTGIFFLAGLAIEDVPKRLFMQEDGNFPTIITVTARKV
ncbi:class I SAM-dependent methyltransferase [Oxalobacter sp. OttesenSCG-928-P03]|nr:class I SAM-dependent methyltransferase [Oxalobacter sp. OttesenSCG-928-P03]